MTRVQQIVEFEIGREYVGKIVGAHGSRVNELVPFHIQWQRANIFLQT